MAMSHTTNPSINPMYMGLKYLCKKCIGQLHNTYNTLFSELDTQYTTGDLFKTISSNCKKSTAIQDSMQSLLNNFYINMITTTKGKKYMVAHTQILLKVLVGLTCDIQVVTKDIDNSSSLSNDGSITSFWMYYLVTEMLPLIKNSTTLAAMCFELLNYDHQEFTLDHILHSNRCGIIEVTNKLKQLPNLYQDYDINFDPSRNMCIIPSVESHTQGLTCFAQTTHRCIDTLQSILHNNKKRISKHKKLSAKMTMLLVLGRIIKLQSHIKPSLISKSFQSFVEKFRELYDEVIHDKNCALYIKDILKNIGSIIFIGWWGQPSIELLSSSSAYETLCKNMYINKQMFNLVLSNLIVMGINSLKTKSKFRVTDVISSVYWSLYKHHHLIMRSSTLEAIDNIVIPNNISPLIYSMYWPHFVCDLVINDNKTIRCITLEVINSEDSSYNKDNTFFPYRELFSFFYACKQHKISFIVWCPYGKRPWVSQKNLETLEKTIENHGGIFINMPYGYDDILSMSTDKDQFLSWTLKSLASAFSKIISYNHIKLTFDTFCDVHKDLTDNFTYDTAVIFYDLLYMYVMIQMLCVFTKNNGYLILLEDEKIVGDNNIYGLLLFFLYGHNHNMEALSVEHINEFVRLWFQVCFCVDWNKNKLSEPYYFMRMHHVMSYINQEYKSKDKILSLQTLWKVVMCNYKELKIITPPFLKSSYLKF